ncbi:MAG: FlgD immunoglobulin-like domain containing protein, partial [Spirochaetia bacterium]
TPLRDFSIPSSDPEIRDGADLQFLFVIDPGGGREILPYARIPNLLDPRTARPWSYKVRDLRTQRGNASVTNNVINPLRGETVKVTYSITQTGMVTINIFDLKGDIVDVLYRGQRTAGEYSTSWDGRNRGNRVVARGVYFIKIVGPGINEIRKVLVVK